MHIRAEGDPEKKNSYISHDSILSLSPSLFEHLTRSLLLFYNHPHLQQEVTIYNHRRIFIILSPIFMALPS